MIHNAKIVDNKVHCPNCDSGNKLSGIRSYSSVVSGSNTYTMFFLKCYGCQTEMRYLADVYVEGTIRYEATNDIEEVSGE